MSQTDERHPDITVTDTDLAHMAISTLRGTLNYLIGETIEPRSAEDKEKFIQQLNFIVEGLETEFGTSFGDEMAEPIVYEVPNADHIAVTNPYMPETSFAFTKGGKTEIENGWDCVGMYKGEIFMSLTPEAHQVMNEEGIPAAILEALESFKNEKS